MATTKKKSDKSKGSRAKQIIILIIILLLLGGNGYLIYHNMQTAKEKDKISKELDKAEKKKKELKEKIDKKIAELEQMKGENAKLDSLITNYETKLKEQKEKLDRYMPLANKANVYKQQMYKYKKAKEKFEAEYDSLKTRIAQLEDKNVQLKDTLTTTKKQVDTLTVENKELSKKVELGSILQAKKIESTGLKEKGNGDYKETDNNKKSDKLRVCFELAKNLVIDPGERKILVQVVQPTGEVMEVEGESGTFKMARNNKEKHYTVAYTFDHNQPDQKRHLCIEWGHDKEELPEGEYKVNLYHKGYNIGSQSFELSSGFLGIF